MVLNQFSNYLFLYFLVLIFTFISFILIFLSYIFVKQNEDIEKISSYECGFQPFEDSRNKFNIKYYLIAILFIIFDLELVFLVPWALTLSDCGIFSFWVMLVFLFILTIGFIYEWKIGALEWD